VEIPLPSTLSCFFRFVAYQNGSNLHTNEQPIYYFTEHPNKPNTAPEAPTDTDSGDKYAPSKLDPNLIIKVH
jgi:hypothetical protein